MHLITRKRIANFCSLCDLHLPHSFTPLWYHTTFHQLWYKQEKLKQTSGQILRCHWCLHQYNLGISIIFSFFGGSLALPASSVPSERLHKLCSAHDDWIGAVNEASRVWFLTESCFLNAFIPQIWMLFLQSRYGYLGNRIWVLQALKYTNVEHVGGHLSKVTGGVLPDWISIRAMGLVRRYTTFYYLSKSGIKSRIFSSFDSACWSKKTFRWMIKWSISVTAY